MMRRWPIGTSISWTPRTRHSPRRRTPSTTRWSDAVCYSAQVHAEYSKFRRETGAEMDIDSYVRLFWWNEGRDPFRRPKLPRALERDVLEHGPPELADLIRRWDAWEADELTRELFAQRRRVADAERALQWRDTKKAREDVRIGTNKVAAAQRRLDVLKGKASDQDHRIY